MIYIVKIHGLVGHSGENKIKDQIDTRSSLFPESIIS